VSPDRCTADLGRPCDARVCPCVAQHGDTEGCDDCGFTGRIACARCVAYDRSVRAEAEAEYRAGIGRADYAESMIDSGRGHLLREGER
jgi:hypothetical protein